MSGVAALKSVGRSDRLEEIRAAGLVRRASEHVGGEVEQVLPVASTLRPLFPGGSLRRGGTVSIATGVNGTGSNVAGSNVAGSTSLLLGLIAEASAAGSWCAVVGLPALGLVAAAETGVAVDRLALIPHPGPDWAGVVAALLDGIEIVVAATPGPMSAQIASRLAARARQRGAVLVAMGQWPGADLTLEVVASTWHGLGDGRGRLRQHHMEIRAHGRGAASRPRRAHLWLPAQATAAPTAVTPAAFSPTAFSPTTLSLASRHVDADEPFEVAREVA